MAWTDYSSTEPNSWSSTIGSVTNSTGVALDSSEPPSGVVLGSTTNIAVSISTLGATYNVPGFDDGYQPAGVPDPIANNIDEGGGGGSARPSSGLLYPRGTS